MPFLLCAKLEVARTLKSMLMNRELFITRRKQIIATDGSRVLQLD